MLQNNPQAQQIQAAMMSHINEHLGFEYRVQIEQQLGASLPPTKDVSGEDIHMDPEVEARLAPLLAQAAVKLLQSNQAQVKQQQAQQQAQDPLVQIQQQEVQIKQAEQQRKAKKDDVDAQIKEKQLQLEEMKSAATIEQQKAQRDIDAMKTVAQLKHDQAESSRTHEMNATMKSADMLHAHSLADKQNQFSQQTKTEPTKKPKGE